jgi:uncharacterized protein
MYQRTLESKIQKELEGYPVIAIMGPRQTGKTTIARKLFPDYDYVLLEDLENRRRAQEDPRGFFSQHQGSIILDEVQKAPDLIAYIQGMVDDPQNKRKFILTGSEHLLLSEKISQSLAGRVRLFFLLPFSQKELSGKNLEEQMFRGGYPRIYDKQLDPQGWLSSYYATYVEKDIRTAANITQVDAFDRVVRLCAARVGQLMDFTNIASSAGVSSPTVKSWVSALKATFICFVLEPHYKNFNKRIVKTPKLYFFDTGLLCYLLRIHSVQELQSHPLYGHIFENWVISEFYKECYNLGQTPNYYFWRDQKGHEVDLIEDRGGVLIPTEIKASKTFHESFLKNIVYLNKLQGTHGGQVIYGGSDSFLYKDFQIQSWKNPS